jgi:hypothetical protein
VVGCGGRTGCHAEDGETGGDDGKRPPQALLAMFLRWASSNGRAEPKWHGAFS